MLCVATEELTPGLNLGPFYPVQRPRDAEPRLWRGRGGWDAVIARS